MLLAFLFLFTLPLDAQPSPISSTRIAGVDKSRWPLGDGGPATEAVIDPTALAWDRDGNLLIADRVHQRIRKRTPDGRISTFFDGAPIQLGSVYSMAVDSNNVLYLSEVAEFAPSRLLRIDPTGATTIIAPPGNRSSPSALLFDKSDYLYLTDQDGFVWKRAPNGIAGKIAGTGRLEAAGASGLPAGELTLVGPHALTWDLAGNLLICDWSGILRLNSDGTLTRIVPAYGPSRIAVGHDGRIYGSDTTIRIYNSFGFTSARPLAPRMSLSD